MLHGVHRPLRVNLLFVLAFAGGCSPAPHAAPAGSRSADLSTRTGEVARRADVLAERTRELEGLYDALRAAPEADKARIRGEIRDRADALKEEAEALRDEVTRIEEGARVY